MLSESTRNIVKSTVPVLEMHGKEITTLFYKTMLGEHKELLNVFNKTNQAKGAQQSALATTVLAAAKHIDDLTPLTNYVKEIGYKHRALQIVPEQYKIVGHYLLRAIKETLGDAATPEIMKAWEETYEEIANVFIGVEAQMYKEAAWPGWKPFKITEKRLIATDIYEFTVVPAEGCDVDLDKVEFSAGQYITVDVHPTRQNNEYDALRHYSLCSCSTEGGLKFAVKLEQTEGAPTGLVSEYLHLDTKVGDIVNLSAPSGDFVLDENLVKQDSIPLVLMAGGVGVTPLLAMLQHQVMVNPNRPVYWIQSSKDRESQAFPAEVAGFLDRCGESNRLLVHTSQSHRIDADYLKKHVPSSADIYICGPIEFMQSMIRYFKILEHKDDSIHYEPFGPKMSTVEV